MQYETRNIDGMAEKIGKNIVGMAEKTGGFSDKQHRMYSADLRQSGKIESLKKEKFCNSSRIPKRDMVGFPAAE